MTKAELGSGTPLTLRIDPENTVTDAQLAEYVFKETGISPDWYPCKLGKEFNSDETLFHPSGSQSPQPDLSVKTSA